MINTCGRSWNAYCRKKHTDFYKIEQKLPNRMREKQEHVTKLL